jgi:hypothetical protein
VITSRRRKVRWSRVASVCTALLIVASVLGPSAVASPTTAGSSTTVVPGTHAQVLALVAAASRITTLPTDLTPTLENVSSDFASPLLYDAGCEPSLAQSTVPACVFGDTSGSRTMVLYGDSHSEMWFDAFENIASSIGWRLVVLTKPYCPPESVSFASPIENGLYTQCTAWHHFAEARIRSLDPSLVVVTGELSAPAPGTPSFTPQTWQAGETKTLKLVGGAGTQEVVLGNIANINVDGPTCLARYESDVQKCSLPAAKLGNLPYYQAERAAAVAVGGRYINVLPWLCSSVCSAVIGNYNVYFNQYHLTATYVTYLTQVLHDALAPSIKAAES